MEVTEPAVGGRRLNIPRSLTSLSNAFSTHFISTRALSGALPDTTARQSRYSLSCSGQLRPYRWQCALDEGQGGQGNLQKGVRGYCAGQDILGRGGNVAKPRGVGTWRFKNVVNFVCRFCSHKCQQPHFQNNQEENLIGIWTCAGFFLVTIH